MREETILQKIEELFKNSDLPYSEVVSEIMKKTISETINQSILLAKHYISKLTIPALLINKNGTILAVNTKWEDTFGYKYHDVLNSSVSSFIPNSQKETFSQIMVDISQSKEFPEQEIKILKKDGISASVGFFAFKPDPESDETIILLRDLSVIKKLEKELTKSRVKLQKSEQFKSVFLANMSHEIRTPMNAIIGFSELINMEGISIEKRKDYSKIINQRGQQLLTLIDDIIETTKIESGRISLDYTWIDLDEFMNDLFSMVLQKKIKEGKDSIELVLEKQDSGSNYQIYTDTGRLHQIFTNLLFYVLKNTSKGNVVFGYKRIDDKEIEFYIQNSGTFLNLEEQKLLFEHFWKIEDTTHLKIKGAGLTLTISKSLIELFGGKINVQSDSQTGTSFFFRLPVVTPNEQTNEITENHFPEEQLINNLDPNWKSKVILVVEDDLINYQFIEALLEKTQAQLLHAENGQQALELCKTINKIDLILMDIKLPEKNGYEITKEIKSFRKDIPIIAQTAFSMNDVKERCFESGCNDIITKPVDIDIFMTKLNKYLY
jgi:PAS domain S-box-containing protein